MITFDFISDPNLKFMLERDYKELEVCFKNKADKSVLILCGSIIEAIFVDYFMLNPPPNYTKDILRAELKDLIELGHKTKLISDRTESLSTVVRNYRNLIHPGREVRENEKFDHDSASVALSLMNIIVNEMRDKFISTRGYTAEEIMQKIMFDEHTLSIFDKLISKISLHERIRLLDQLTEYDSSIGEPEIEARMYIGLLKPYVPQVAIKEQLLKLKRYVEQDSSSYRPMKLYNYYHQDLLLLDIDSRETIILYAISILNESIMKRGVRSYIKDKTFSTLGRYLLSERLIQAFETLIATIIYNVKSAQRIDMLDIYELLINSPTVELEKRINDYILRKGDIGKLFIEEYNNGDYLPF
jgi:hypothetical protein